MTAELSIDALSLVSTLYPVGIGLLMLEVFRLKGTPRVRLKGGIYSRASAFALAISAWPAFLATAVAFNGVLNDDPIDGWLAAVIRLAGTLLGTGCWLMLVELTWAARQIDTTSGDGVGAPSPPVPTAPPKKKRRKRGGSR